MKRISSFNSVLRLLMDTIGTPVSFLSSGECFSPLSALSESGSKPFKLLGLLNTRLQERVDLFGREVAY